MARSADIRHQEAIYGAVSMTIVHTDLPEETLLEAIRQAMAPEEPTNDPGLTITELAEAEYGNAWCGSRDKISKRLKPLIASGVIKRGFKRGDRIDGQRYRVAVFSVVEAQGIPCLLRPI